MKPCALAKLGDRQTRLYGAAFVVGDYGLLIHSCTVVA